MTQGAFQKRSYKARPVKNTLPGRAGCKPKPKHFLAMHTAFLGLLHSESHLQLTVQKGGTGQELIMHSGPWRTSEG